MSVKVSGLTKLFGEQKAVDHISFELKKGEIVGFLGPNGAGKSTTMKMITGYLPPTEGIAEVCGYDVSSHPMEVRKRIGYLPESNPLYFEMYVREYLNFSANIHQLRNKKSRVEEMINLTGLYKEAHKKIGALSKGYKQRVGLAQSMLHNPEVLILDEPTTGLDPNQIVEIRALIKDIGREKTVLLSTHIMQEVQAMCTRAIIISSGKIVADNDLLSLQRGSQEKALLVRFDGRVSTSFWKKLTQIKSKEKIDNDSYRITALNTDLLRKEMMREAVTHDILISEMKVETQSLEEVFRSLTK